MQSLENVAERFVHRFLVGAHRRTLLRPPHCDETDKRIALGGRGKSAGRLGFFVRTILHVQHLAEERGRQEEKIGKNEYPIFEDEAVDHEAGRGRELSNEQPVRHTRRAAGLPLRVHLA